VDVITLAGGLRRDASSYATIHYNDPLDQNRKYYRTIDNLYDLFENPEDSNNIALSPFDSLEVKSLNELDKKLFVRIEGAVNEPGQYQFGEDMTI
jgi:protein involved in polysaccharide export with SLBB domain